MSKQGRSKDFSLLLPVLSPWLKVTSLVILRHSVGRWGLPFCPWPEQTGAPQLLGRVIHRRGQGPSKVQRQHAEVCVVQRALSPATSSCCGAAVDGTWLFLLLPCLGIPK